MNRLQRFVRSIRRSFADAPLVLDADFAAGAAYPPRDRQPVEREEILRAALLAWQTNPLARRIVGLTTQYVVGGGVQLSSPDARAASFLQTWWSHPLNHLAVRCVEWCDELTRSGELFFLLSTGADGMTYLRAVPALQIAEIDTAPNDLQQETAYRLRPAAGEGWDGRSYPAYDPAADFPGPDGRFPAVMLHYAVNRPVGSMRGESDLAPLLKWLTRYAAWLEDRARLNRYRTTFLYVVKTRFLTDADRRARQTALSATPPAPGSILVTDEGETWDTLSPRLEADDASADGLALKKMIAAGAGVPLHFLAEPESSTRTTAESAGGPAFRHFEQRQQFFLWLLSDLAQVALRRRAACDRSLSGDEPVSVAGADLSARDNAELAGAAAQVIEAFSKLHLMGLIPAGELLRVAYRFAGEPADADALLRAAKQ
jgi:hypothetical protein